MNDLRSHRNNFNLIRLLAASQVLFVHVAHHIGFEGPLITVISLFPGVPIFFFISGFLIYASFDRLTSNGWKAFYFNRIVRIYPALIACTAVSLVAVYFTGYFHGRSINAIRFVTWVLGQVTIVQFYNPPFMREFGVGVLNGALWTIAVEVQFYVLVPFMYFLLHERKRAWIALFSCSVIANLLLRQWSESTIPGWKFLGVSFLPWIWIFLIGFWLSSHSTLQQRVLRLNGWVLLVAFVVSMYVIPDVKTNSSNSINPVSVVLMTVLVLKLASVDLGAFGRIFFRTDISYGLYVYHMPIISLVLYTTQWGQGSQAIVIIAASYVMAAVSWILIEKPALDLKKRMTPKKLVLNDISVA